MSIKFVVYNNKIIKFGSTGAGTPIVYDSENSGSSVTTDPITSMSMYVTSLGTTIAWELNGTCETFDHYEYWITGQSSNKHQTTASSISTDTLISQYNLTAPNNSTRDYTIRVQAISTSGAKCPYGAATFTVIGEIVDDPDPIIPTSDPFTTCSVTIDNIDSTISNSSAYSYTTVATSSTPSGYNIANNLAYYECILNGETDSFMTTNTSVDLATVLTIYEKTIANNGTLNVAFKVRAVSNTGATTGWTTKTVTFTNTTGDVFPSQGSSGDDLNVDWMDITPYFNFVPDNGSSNARVIGTIVTPSENITFNSLTVYDLASTSQSNSSGANTPYVRIYELSAKPGTADGGSGSGKLSGLYSTALLENLNDTMKLNDGAVSNCAGIETTLGGKTCYKYVATHTDGTSITLQANHIYAIGITPNTNFSTKSETKIPVLADYTITNGSSNDNGYYNGNNSGLSTTAPTRCGQFNSPKESMTLYLPYFELDGVPFTKFKGFTITEGGSTGPAVTLDPILDSTITKTGTYAWTLTPNASTFKEYEIRVDGQSGVMKTTSTSTTGNAIINYFSLTAPQGSTQTYNINVKAISDAGNYANGTVTSTVTVTGEIVETDPMLSASIIASANTTTISWTNLSSVSTFSTYKYWIGSNTSSTHTINTNSISIETLVSQFDLNDNQTYTFNVVGISTTTPNTTSTATATFTTPEAVPQLPVLNCSNIKSLNICDPGNESAATGGDKSTAYAFEFTPKHDKTFTTMSIFIGRGSAKSTKNETTWCVKLFEDTGNGTTAIKTIDNTQIYATTSSSSTSYNWIAMSDSSEHTPSVTIDGVSTHEYKSRLSNGNNITLQAGHKYIIGLCAGESGSNATDWETLVYSDNRITDGTYAKWVQHSISSSSNTFTGTTANGKYLYFELDDVQYTDFEGVDAVGTIDSPIAVEDLIPSQTITVTATTDTVSWTNLNSVSGFDHYEYTITGYTSNTQTTTSNSVSIATLKSQYSLTDGNTYTFRVSAKSTQNGTTSVATGSFTVPANSSGDQPSVTTITTWTEDFSNGITCAVANTPNWYNFYENSGKLQAVLREPDTTETYATFNINITGDRVLDLSSGGYLSFNIQSINSEPNSSDAVSGASWNNYCLISVRVIDSLGGASKWINIGANGSTSSTDGISPNDAATVSTSLASYISGSTLDASKIVGIEIGVIGHIGAGGASISYKARNKGVELDNIRLSTTQA